MVALLVVVMLGGSPKSLGSKAIEADLILEYEVVFDSDVMRAPDPLKVAGHRAKPVRALLGTVPAKPPPLKFVAGSTDKCVALADKKGRVRALAFFKKGEQVYGIEQQLPTLTDLDADYTKVVSALEAFVRWRRGAKVEPEPGNRFAKVLAAALTEPDDALEWPVERECD